MGLVTMADDHAGRLTLMQRDDSLPEALDSTWRILLPYGAQVELRSLHLSRGAIVERPPSRAVRWLAHGDSITQGARAIAPGLTYVNLVADALGWDALNLGFGGSAWGDAVVAEYIASREDWDVLSIAIGTNTFAGSVETPAAFAKRYATFLSIIRQRHPTKPVLCISPIWRGADGPPCETNALDVTPEAYRVAIRGVVAPLAQRDPNLRFVDGLALLGDDTGLGIDRVHPDAHGMLRMSLGLIDAWRDLLGFGS